MPHSDSELRVEVSRREPLSLAVAAVALTTFFALLYALRGGITLLDRGEPFVWREQVVMSLLVWWMCLPLLPPLAWLVRHAPLRGPRISWHRTIGSLGILLGGTLCLAIVRHYLLSAPVTWLSGIPATSASAIARILTYFTTFLVMAGMLYAVHFYRDLRIRELETERLARSLAEARLTALRAQLHPHFVFNVLNAITTLLHRDVMLADRMLTRFADLLRTVLQTGEADMHTLRDEMLVLRQYVELMQLRFGDALRVTWDVDPSLLDMPVPHMLLQPLVENAIEHGLSSRGDERGASGTVRIIVSSNSGMVELAVEDDGVGLSRAEAPPASIGVRSHGVGLSNLRERLQQHYQSHALFALSDRVGGGARAIVRLPKWDGAQ